jgi:MipA family protein
MRQGLLAILILVIPAGLDGQEPPPPVMWNVSVGAGAFAFPSYPGSDQYRVVPFPMVNASFRDRVYLGPSSTGIGFALGAYPVHSSPLRLAVELGGQDSRPASRADALAGMEDRDAVATAGASLSYRTGAFEGIVALSQGVNDGAGLIQTTRVVHSRLLGKVMLSAAVGAALANGRQMRREFGITEAEAARREALGDGGIYQPEGGLRHLGAGLSVIYPVSRSWSLIGLAAMEWLADEAANSPLVRRREQVWSGIGVGYRLF